MCSRPSREGCKRWPKVRPDDPVDYLAEYLFNLDPELA